MGTVPNSHFLKFLEKRDCPLFPFCSNLGFTSIYLSSISNQDIHLENREKLNISGVKDVLSFDDQMVILETELGLLTIKGENLRINKLSIDTLDVSIDGMINSLNYSAVGDNKKITKGNSFINKIFK